MNKVTSAATPNRRRVTNNVRRDGPGLVMTRQHLMEWRRRGLQRLTTNLVEPREQRRSMAARVELEAPGEKTDLVRRRARRGRSPQVPAVRDPAKCLDD